MPDGLICSDIRIVNKDPGIEMQMEIFRTGSLQCFKFDTKTKNNKIDIGTKVKLSKNINIMKTYINLKFDI